MLRLLDVMIRDLLVAELPALVDDQQVRFQPPDAQLRTDVANLSAVALDVYLVDVRENRKLRSNERVRSVDADGFVTIHGRADGAINRGGFKVLPETVRAVLVSHPAVRDACVIGLPDTRLGQVPVAAVELRHSGGKPSEDDLKTLVRNVLPSHHVPVAIVVVEQLPRNAALKVRPADVAALFEARRS